MNEHVKYEEPLHSQSGFAGGIPADAMERAWLGALRSKEKGVQHDAAESLVMVGRVVLKRLVDEVVNKRRSQEYRLRLLKVIGRIGPGADPHTFARLALLTGDPDVDVRVAASEVLFSSRLGPPRPDWQKRARKVWVF